jgi:hypothetical protein
MALIFNGTSNYALVPTSTAMNTLTNSITIMAWVYRTGSGSLQAIISRSISGTAQDEWWHLNYRNSKARIIFGDVNGVINVEGGPTLTRNTWYHIAATYDGTTISLYINGVKYVTSAWSGAFAPDTSPVSIGCDINGGIPGEYVSAWIEDVRVYSRALAAEEIMTVYTIRGGDVIVGGLLMRYPMSGNGSISTTGSLVDVGAYGLHGNPSNTITYTQSLLTQRSARR